MNDIKKLLGKRIKELRTKKGLTQERLAELVGVGERNLSKIECGNNFVTAETLSRILVALEVDAKELFDFAHHKSQNALKEELTKAIQNNAVDIELMYKIYKSIM